MPAITGLLPEVYKALSAFTSYVKPEAASVTYDNPNISLTREGGVTYDDAILTLTREGAPDPFVTRSGDNYYLTFTVGDRIEMQCSNKFLDLDNPAGRHVIWTPPDDTDHSADLWAPELHSLDGRWYVYYAAAHPSLGNGGHRMFVLGGPPANEDPCRGSWESLGRVGGTPADQWAIDGTVFALDGSLYFAYSGWPLDHSAAGSELVQELFIARMKSPTSVDGPPASISRPDQEWEITRDANGAHGVNEGPQFLAAPDGSWKGLAYSCAGSWTPQYKMATLQYVGGDPMDPRSWRKSSGPLIAAKAAGDGVWGPGHGSFLSFGDEVVAVFHATDRPTHGWADRRARVQRVLFTSEGPFNTLHFCLEIGGNRHSLTASSSLSISALSCLHSALIMGRAAEPLES
ncbi:hypothetical protein DL766_003548 [Monosporascus sp. MC13-8B]|uniref:Uncharacterized protein n=1 Tax=Monosporascus cannonballus TaxID=155416 RepID=A0ABY0H7K4_9PEZI|nr:hypothetical protein DL763_009323 [Monosporascus cannonballus]RYO86655.1 hypothetical protein DL762_004667 [Monosporascus cannonballus]RYP33319.1 hypothetical protein DL766_003548 [Monosporascus sp. MC13-8B]